MMNLDDLFKPFQPSLVSWRVGSMTKDKKKARALAYIDARDVMRRLDAVCGPAGWQCRYPHANGKTVCEIGIKIDGEWVWKANGAGDTDIEAEKGAISDAFKRAAVLWGVGRYLYDLDSPWVEVNEFKQIEKHEHARLEKILAGARIETPEPVKEDRKQAAISEKPPAGVEASLWETAYARAGGGTASYQSFWINDTTKDERAILAPFHEALKARAATMNNHPAVAAVNAAFPAQAAE